MLLGFVCYEIVYVSCNKNLAELAKIFNLDIQQHFGRILEAYFLTWVFLK